MDTEEKEKDVINSPDHYKLPGMDVECIDVIRAVLGPDKFSGFCRGNTIKYLVRADRKNGTEDLEKAQKYLAWEIESRKISGGGAARKEIAAPDPEPKKKPQPKKKKQEKAFDMGKLRALHEGGWSVVKIADEMGVLQQTIYNKLKEL